MVLTMSGVQGLGSGASAIAGQAGLASSLNHLGLQVNQQNVLDVRKILLVSCAVNSL